MNSQIYESTTRHPVVFVHGLWMSALDSTLLRQRLARAGFAPSLFRYHSTRASMKDITVALAARLRACGPRVHLIGHSLGGVIALETLERFPDLPPGRVVLMGAPVRGSRVARSLARHAFGRAAIGPLAIAELARERERRWLQARELGLIAGARSIGVGRFIARLPVPNDGTVCVDETRLPGAAQHIVLDVSHIGMLLSLTAAGEIGAFLACGRFASVGLASNS